MPDTTLDVVNDCIALLGESPLNSLEEDHPMVASALAKLRVANTREQAKSWWFNRELVDLQPDPITNFVFIPEDTISIDPLNPWTHLVARGRRLYDPNGAGYTIGRAVRVRMVRKVPFEDLPALAKVYIGICAQLDFGKDYDADARKTELLLNEKRETYTVLNAENIRATDSNLLYRGSVLAKMNMLGGRGLMGYGGGVLPNTTQGITPAPVDLPNVDYVAVFEDAENGS